MQIDAEKWTALRQSVAADDLELFHKLVWDFVHVAVHHEQARKKAHDRARAIEQGGQPYLASERVHR